MEHSETQKQFPHLLLVNSWSFSPSEHLTEADCRDVSPEQGWSHGTANAETLVEEGDSALS